MINLSKNSTPNYCLTNHSIEKQPLKKQIMRRQFKQLFRGLAELAAVFTAVFAGPALIAALVNFDISVYFACIHDATYCVLLTILGIIVTMFYTAMHQ
jgi:hypothetical protein